MPLRGHLNGKDHAPREKVCCKRKEFLKRLLARMRYVSRSCAAPMEGGCGAHALLRLAGTKSERLDLVYAREPPMHLRGDTFPTYRALPPHPLQRLGERLAA